MSEEISTQSPQIKIYSQASGMTDRFNLTATHTQEGDIATAHYGWNEYADEFKKFWEKYLETGELPRLVDQPLSKEGFLEETLHCIAPSGFFDHDTPPLSDNREALVYWIQSQRAKVGSRIGQNVFGGFNNTLELILSIHLDKKLSPGNRSISD